MENRLKTANILRNTARYSLLLIGTVAFIFSLISGAEHFGGGIQGVIKNSPNAIPWLILLVLVLVAWKNEILGGILLTILGLIFIYFFNFSGPLFWWATFIFTTVLTLLGSFFIISHFLRNR